MEHASKPEVGVEEPSGLAVEAVDVGVGAVDVRLTQDTDGRMRVAAAVGVN